MMNSSRRRVGLLAAALTVTVAAGLHAGTTYNNAIVFCKATIQESGQMSGNYLLSVELPPTPGYTDPDGNPVTIWNVGNVPAGGVADTWHDGGPGYFTVRNTGNVGSFVYVVGIARNEYNDVPAGGTWDYQAVLGHLFGYGPPQLFPRPEPFTPESYGGETYHLALTTDVTARAPTWRSLDHVSRPGLGYPQAGWDYQSDPLSFQCSAYLSWMPPGEYQPFDLKFWGPAEFTVWNGPVFFVFRVEASAFPRWEHDRY